MRPLWVLGWTGATTVLLATVLSTTMLLVFVLDPGPVVPLGLLAPAPMLVLFAGLWLGSASRFGIVLATVGALFLGVFTPMYAFDKVLAAVGETTMATVSKVDTTTSPHGVKSYTAWLADGYGRPIPRPLDTSRARRVGEQFEVVFDPHGLLSTDTWTTSTRTWPLPVVVASGLAMIVGLALMARRQEAEA